MTGLRPRVVIITGYGLNCEAESSLAWEMAGAEVERIHLKDLLEAPARLRDFQALMFIGGFSYGDHMGSGHVFALRVRHHLGDELRKFVAEGKLILGVCNGFQIMTKIGLLPAIGGDYLRQEVALIRNDCGSFQDRWVHLRFDSHSQCVFTRGLETMPLPVRHGEGKFHVSSGRFLEELERRGCVVCRYVDPATREATQQFPWNPNGSVGAVAGICDPSGRVFGLMPHPEAYLFPENHPRWDLHLLAGKLAPEGQGLKIFRNAVEYLRRA